MSEKDYWSLLRDKTNLLLTSPTGGGDPGSSSTFFSFSGDFDLDLDLDPDFLSASSLALVPSPILQVWVCT